MSDLYTQRAAVMFSVKPEDVTEEQRKSAKESYYREAYGMDQLPVISTNLPDLVDSYIDARAARLEADKVAASLKENEEELKKVIIAKYREGGMFALGGTRGLVKMKESQEPTCTDWPALYAFIKANDAWEMLHKRVTVTAVKERWDAGVQVPGVIAVPTYSLSVSKL